MTNYVSVNVFWGHIILKHIKMMIGRQLTQMCQKLTDCLEHFVVGSWQYCDGEKHLLDTCVRIIEL